MSTMGTNRGFSAVAGDGLFVVREERTEAAAVW
jgi:hypothetical protein